MVRTPLGVAPKPNRGELEVHPSARPPFLVENQKKDGLSNTSRLAGQESNSNSVGSPRILQWADPHTEGVCVTNPFPWPL